MKIFDYVRRLFGTAFGFTVFGIVSLILGLVLFPLLFIFFRDSCTRTIIARGLIGKAFGGFVWLMKTVGVMDYQVEGSEHISCSHNQLIVANHPTLIDVVILISIFPQANCVIKSVIMRNVFMRNTVGAADYIPNNAPGELLEACIRSLKSGGSLMLFPEGTRTIQDKPIAFELGAAEVAARSGAEILPIAIECKPVFLTRQLAWYYVPPSKPQFTIRILPPVAIEDLAKLDNTKRHIRRDLNDKLLKIIRRALEDISLKEDMGV